MSDSFIPNKAAFDGRITDGEKFDNQWVFVFEGRCIACGKGIGQKISFPRRDPQGRECPKLEDKVVEYEMFQALRRNHACKALGDLVGPDGRKLPGSFVDGLEKIADGKAWLPGEGHA